MMTRKVWKMWAYCSLTYFSRSSEGLAASAVPTSEATRTASRRGERAGIEPAIRSLVQRNSAASAVSISARKAIRPNAMRQYRLRYQRSSPRGDVDGDEASGRTVSGTPDRENGLWLAGGLLDLLAQPFHQRVDAAHGHEGLIFPDPAEERLSTEHDTWIREQDVQQLEFVEGEVDVAMAYAHAAPG